MPLQSGIIKSTRTRSGSMFFRASLAAAALSAQSPRWPARARKRDIASAVSALSSTIKTVPMDVFPAWDSGYPRIKMPHDWVCGKISWEN